MRPPMDPAVVQDAQRYDWREDLESIEACEEVWDCADGCCTNFMPHHNDECIRLAAYIERLEAERVIMRNGNVMTQGDYEWLADLYTAYDNAERVIHGE